MNRESEHINPKQRKFIFICTMCLVFVATNINGRCRLTNIFHCREHVVIIRTNFQCGDNIIMMK